MGLSYVVHEEVSPYVWFEADTLFALQVFLQVLSGNERVLSYSLFTILMAWFYSLEYISYL